MNVLERAFGAFHIRMEQIKKVIRVAQLRRPNTAIAPNVLNPWTHIPELQATTQKMTPRYNKYPGLV